MEEIRLRFKLAPDKIELGQLIDMQDGDLRAMRDVLALSLVGDDDEFMELDKAKTIIGKRKLSQVREMAEEFVRQIKDTAVNPTSAVS